MARLNLFYQYFKNAFNKYLNKTCWFYFPQAWRVGGDVLPERAAVSERTPPDPTGAAVSHRVYLSLLPNGRCPTSQLTFIFAAVAAALCCRWESSSQSLRLHLLQLKGLNRCSVRDGYKVWVHPAGEKQNMATVAAFQCWTSASGSALRRTVSFFHLGDSK